MTPILKINTPDAPTNGFTSVVVYRNNFCIIHYGMGYDKGRHEIKMITIKYFCEFFSIVLMGGPDLRWHVEGHLLENNKEVSKVWIWNRIFKYTTVLPFIRFLIDIHKEGQKQGRNQVRQYLKEEE